MCEVYTAPKEIHQESFRCLQRDLTRESCRTREKIRPKELILWRIWGSNCPLDAPFCILIVNSRLVNIILIDLTKICRYFLLALTQQQLHLYTQTLSYNNCNWVFACLNLFVKIGIIPIFCNNEWTGGHCCSLLVNKSEYVVRRSKHA